MNKKKIILYTLSGVIILFFATVVVMAIAFDSLIKKTVETVGPEMTQTTFTLDAVDIRLLKGVGTLRGLMVGNPEKYTADFAMKIDEAVLDLHAGTVFSEKLVIESIKVVGPEITFEGGHRENNLREIGANIAEFIGSREESEHLNRKLQVNHFLLTDAKVHLRLSLFGMKEITLKAPKIELSNLGKGAEGITSAELTELIVKKISSEVSRMVGSTLTEIESEGGATGNGSASNGF